MWLVLGNGQEESFGSGLRLRAVGAVIDCDDEAAAFRVSTWALDEFTTAISELGHGESIKTIRLRAELGASYVDPGDSGAFLEARLRCPEGMAVFAVVDNLETTDIVLPERIRQHLAGEPGIQQEESELLRIPLRVPQSRQGFIPAGGMFQLVRFMAVRLFPELTGNIADRIADFLAERIEPRFKETQQFRRVAAGFADMSKAEVGELQGTHALLFVHGIFSSTQLAFKDLLHAPAAPSSPAAAWTHLNTQYEGRLFGWDHWTLARRPFENAREMLAGLPAGSKLDIVCHSRGGAVVRNLLQHPELQRQLGEQDIRIGKVVFVAAANQGSNLARVENWESFIRLLVNIARLVPGGLGEFIQGAAALLLCVLNLASRIDSLTDLAPDSAMYRALEGARSVPVEGYRFARADFGAREWTAMRAIDELADRLHGLDVKNDLVVPFEGAGLIDRSYRPAPSELCEFGNGDAQPYVNHVTFFGNPQLQRFLVENLVTDTAAVPVA